MRYVSQWATCHFQSCLVRNKTSTRQFVFHSPTKARQPKPSSPTPSLASQCREVPNCLRYLALGFKPLRFQRIVSTGAFEGCALMVPWKIGDLNCYFLTCSCPWNHSDGVINLFFSLSSSSSSPSPSPSPSSSSSSSWNQHFPASCLWQMQPFLYSSHALSFDAYVGSTNICPQKVSLPIPFSEPPRSY